MIQSVRTIDEVIANLGAIRCERLPVPNYVYSADGPSVALALKSFERHMTDEGHQLQCGWENSGVELYGRHYPFGRGITDANSIVDGSQASVCIVQDRREWDRKRPSCFDRQAGFCNTRMLRGRSSLFRVTVCKDAHGDPEWTRTSHRNLAPHAWLIYYHPRIVCHLAGWLRPEHCIRVYHTVDKYAVPEFSASERAGMLLSGAVLPSVYPLRWNLRCYWRRNGSNLPGVTVRRHPGYNALGSHTPQFLRDLAKFKVSICTSSIYGYSLRKIIESVACGCVVVTDLPVDDALPEIDEALVRIRSDSRPEDVFELCRELENGYDADYREHFASKAVEFYDWRASGRRQIDAIEAMRANYQ